VQVVTKLHEVLDIEYLGEEQLQGRQEGREAGQGTGQGGSFESKINTTNIASRQLAAPLAGWWDGLAGWAGRRAF
jgi:hypothetical protein